MHENFPVTCFSLQLSRLLCIGCFQRPFKIFLNWFLEILINWCTQVCYIQPILSDASNQCSLCCVCLSVCMCACARVCTCLGRTEDGTRFPGVASFRQLAVDSARVDCALSSPFNVVPSNATSNESFRNTLLLCPLHMPHPSAPVWGWERLAQSPLPPEPEGTTGSRAPFKLTDQRQIFL